MRRSSILNIDEWVANFPEGEPDSIIYESDYHDGIASSNWQRMQPVLEKYTKLISNLLSGIGFNPDQIRDRAGDEQLEYLEDCCKIFWQQISDDVDKISRYKEETLKQVQSMMKTLYDREFKLDEDVPLMQQCKMMRSQYIKLDEIRQKRLKRFKELRDIQISHCLLLGISPPQVGSQKDIPSEKDLEDLTSTVSKLKQKENEHREKYKQLKKSILEYKDKLELEDLEEDCIHGEPRYTEDHLHKMSELEDKLREQYSINQKKFDEITARLNSLFDRLDIDQSERNKVLNECSNCSPKTIALMEYHVEYYEDQKKRNIGKFIEKIKEELTIEYERCCESQDKQDNFFALSNVSGECNEELLELYEREYDRIKEYYQNNREILDNFHKWRAMWRELIEIELKANDPNRFNNRGGQLLHEERKRKGLQKALPKLEQELGTLCEKYSANHEGNKLKVYDTELGEFIAGCWDELNTAKEEEKRQRQRAKMTLSTSSNNVRKPLPLKRTPAKRAAGAGFTPTPSKLSISETEFEHLIRGCPASAKKKR